MEEEPEELTFKKPFYYAKGDDQPYCPRCFEVDGQSVHLLGPDVVGHEHKQAYSCANCSTGFFSDGSRSFKL